MTPADRERLSEDLSAYLDGELEPPRSLEVEALLLESREVRAMLKDLRRVSQRVAALPRVASPIDIAATVRQQIDGPAVRAPAAAWAWPLRTYVGATSAAAAVLLISLAFWTMRPTPDVHPRKRAEPPPAGGGWPPLALATRERVEVAEGARLRDADGTATPSPGDAVAMGVPAETFRQPPAQPGAAAAEPNHSATPPIAAAARLDAVEPAGAREGAAAAGLHGGAELALGEPAVALRRTAASPAAPLRAAGAAASAAAPGPLVRIRVQTASPESYRRALDIAGRLQRNAARDAEAAGAHDADGVEVVGELEIEQVGAVLSAFERQTGDEVQIALDFSARDLPRVRRLLREQPGAPVARGAPDASEAAPGAADLRQQIYMQQHPNGDAAGRRLATTRSARQRIGQGTGADVKSSAEARGGAGGAVGQTPGSPRPAAARGRASTARPDPPAPPASGPLSIGRAPAAHPPALGGRRAIAEAATAPGGADALAMRTGLLLVDGWLAGAQSAAVARAAREAGAGRVSLGITVLPPPRREPPATQPAPEPR